MLSHYCILLVWMKSESCQAVDKMIEQTLQLSSFLLVLSWHLPVSRKNPLFDWEPWARHRCADKSLFLSRLSNSVRFRGSPCFMPKAPSRIQRNCRTNWGTNSHTESFTLSFIWKAKDLRRWVGCTRQWTKTRVLWYSTEKWHFAHKSLLSPARSPSSAGS